MNASLKTGELLKKVRDHIHAGTYVISAHALQRKNERQIDLKHVLYVLKTGAREEEKEGFDFKRQVWKYAIRGVTVEGIGLRVIIAFDGEMVIITVMRVK